jgi:hypothetical protein
MGEKQKRPAHAGAAQSRHQVPLARTGGQNLDVRGWKAAVAQSRPMASAARNVSPEDSVVLISISSR